MVTPPARGGCSGTGHERAHADDNNTLYFYNWTEYVPPDCLNSSPKKPVLRLSIRLTIERNHVRQVENVQRRCLRPGVPSTYYVDKMRKEGMIQKIESRS